MPKSKKVILETGKQTRAAIREIQRKTEWSLGRIADEAGLTRETLRKIHTKATTNPGPAARDAVGELLGRARTMP